MLGSYLSKYPCRGKYSVPKYIPNLGMKTEPVADGADAMVFCPAFVYTYLGQIPFNLLLLQWLGFNAEIQIILGTVLGHTRTAWRLKSATIV